MSPSGLAPWQGASSMVRDEPQITTHGVGTLHNLLAVPYACMLHYCTNYSVYYAIYYANYLLYTSYSMQAASVVTSPQDGAIKTEYAEAATGTVLQGAELALEAEQLILKRGQSANRFKA